MAKKVYVEIVIDDKGTTKKVAVDAERLGIELNETANSSRKAQRGIKGVAGTASAGGKNFSKMAGTINGGLVPAYAMLAAQIFAVSEAFNFLKDAGSLKQLQEGQAAYASVTGTSMKALTTDIIAATDGIISFKEAAQAAAIGTASGLSPDQITKLGAAARTTSQVLGRDLTDSFNRLVRGVTKAEPELLDELGIILRLEDASNKYAQSLNIQGKLTAFQRSQAVTADVLRQVEERYGAVIASNSIATNEFAALGKSFDDLVNKIRMVSVELAGPIAKLLSEYPALIVAAFAPFASQLISGALPQLGRLGSTLTSLEGKAATMYTNLTVKQQQYAVATAKAGDQRKFRTEIEKTSRTAITNIEKTTRIRKNSVLQQIKEGKILNKRQIADLRKRLAQESGLYASFNKKRKADLLRTLKQMEIYNKSSSSKMARDFGAGVTLMQTRLVGLGAAALGVFGTIAAGAKVAGAAIATAFSILSWVALLAALGGIVYAFLRTKEEVSETALKAEALRLRLKTINDESKDFYEKQLEINQAIDRSVQGMTAFGNRLRNISNQDMTSIVSDLSMDDNKNSRTADFAAANDRASAAARELQADLKKLEDRYETLKKRGGSVSQSLFLIAEKQKELNAANKLAGETFFQFIQRTNDAESSISLSAKALEGQLKFLRETNNEYLKNSAPAKAYRDALTLMEQGQLSYTNTLNDTKIALEQLGMATDEYSKLTVENKKATTNLFQNILPSNDMDARIVALKEELSVLDRIKETSKMELLPADQARYEIMEAEVALITRLNTLKHQQSKLVNAISIAETRMQVGATRLMKVEISHAAKTFRANTNLINVRQKAADILLVERALKDQLLEIGEAVTDDDKERKGIILTSLSARGREVDNLRQQEISLESQLEILKLQNSEIEKIKNGMMQAFESSLQTGIGDLIKGKESSLKDSILKIGQGVLNSVADNLAEIATKKIMLKLFKQESPEETMKRKIKEGMEDGSNRHYESILDASALGADLYKKAIIEASGGTYTASASPGGGGTVPTVPGGPATPATPTSAGSDSKVGFFEKLLGKKTVAKTSVQELDADGNPTGSVIEGPGKKGRSGGMFSQFINDFGAVFDKNAEGGFLGKMGNLFGSFGEGLGSLFKGLPDLLGGLFGGAGGGGLGSLFGGLFGGARHGGIMKGYATGGIAKGKNAGYPAILHGTEAVVPLPSGGKIPVEMKNGASGGTNNVSINVNMSNDGTSQTDSQNDGKQGADLGKMLASAVQEELQRQKRPGGILSPYGAA